MAEFNLLLGSQSPRRRDLISALGFDVRAFSINCEESFSDELKEAEIPEFLAKKKSLAYDQPLQTGEILVTADTIVWHNNRVLEKPQNREEAIKMISELSGDVHSVYTGVCIRSVNDEVVFHEHTKVFFDDLNASDIAFYVDEFGPFDKAGGYGIQEWIGFIGVKKIEGCYYNVMGLPLNALYRTLKDQFMP